MKLLIVDDNRHIVDSIRDSVNWPELGIEKVYGCYHAAEAREVLLKDSISFMITDIEMPGQSGLELAAWAKENDLGVDVVFLTSHADFSYAQQAISLQCFEYMMKPAGSDKIEQTVKRMVTRRRQQGDTKRRQEGETHGGVGTAGEIHMAAGDEVLENRELVRHIFWRDFMENMINTREDSLARRFNKYSLGYTLKSLFTPVLFCYRFDGKPDYTESVLKLAADNIIAELAAGEGLKLEADIRNGNYRFMLIFSNPGGKDEKVAALLDSFFKVHCRFFAGWVNCYAGSACTAGELLEQTALLEEISLDDTERKNETILATEYRRQEKEYVTPEIASWQSMLLAGEDGTLLKSFRDYFARLKRGQSISRQLLEAFLADFLQAELFVLRQKGISAYHFLAHCRDRELYDKAVNSVADMEAYLADEMRKVNAQLGYANAAGDLMAEVKAFIDENLQDVTRSMVAERFSLSPNYLSKLFAKSTGEALRDYIYRERMLLAMALLKNSRESISTIAELSGYPSFAHFSKMFKKQTGKTPAEYRRGEVPVDISK